MIFLRNVLATLVGLILFFGLIFAIFGGIIAAASQEPEVEVKENSVLHLKLNKPIVERKMDDPFSELPLPGFDDGTIGLLQIRSAIQAAKEDESIKGIYLDAGLSLGGFASLEEIRNDLIDFKESGKFILSYSDFLSEQAYYIASVADELYIHPDWGGVEFNGFMMETVFIKETLDKLGLKPEIFRVGDFKSAIEPLTRTSMSDSSRAQTVSFLNSLYDTYLNRIETSTDISESQLRSLADSMKIREPQDAVDANMVTGLRYPDEVRDLLREKLGLEEGESEEDDDDINFISVEKYSKAVEARAPDYSRNRVAVIVASGSIVNGEGDMDNIGGDRFAKEIRKAREDDNVKAMVIRINSGGGSALASDKMWREIQLAKQEKPVIASMSDVAASGGYYMAMGCDTIVAHPNTITGSIGIFGAFFNVEGMLDKIGVDTEIVQTGEFADIFSPSKPMSEAERRIIQNGVEQGYETFTSKAAEGRNMTVEQLKKVASGRVWSGTEALERDLVDVLGGLDDAVAIAVAKAGLEEDDYRIKYYPENKDIFQQIMEELGQEVSTQLLKRELGDAFPYVQQFQQVRDWQGIQARMPFMMEIK
ncbi:signal peptide peptidase SppA [Tunicatimonas pelagia]|uniref:signal peptide peptidase SppA n=1 Tax=Tunicatimonas pelagia TaxID=931531 RepID=UPI002666F5E9|nr:signal peptide peptidase SppA [Tunicatimonas pelagia]WKN40531.1 signal peptide peptidase SppA [Tunicatimonas pelagia]